MIFKMLSISQKNTLREAGVLNGCGPRDWRWPKINWFFEASCFEHDYNYAVGGTEADRKRADWGFFEAMKRDITLISWWKRPFARIQAQIFYTLVRFLGKSRFYYGEKRSYDDILAAGNSARG